MTLNGAFSLKRLAIPLILIVTLFHISIPPAYAQAEFTFDETQFLALNPGLEFLDFVGTSDPLPQVCANPATSNSDDGCFSPGQIPEGIEFAIVPGGNPNDLVLFQENFFGINNNPPNVLCANIGGVNDSFNIVFTASGINAVGLNAGCVSESNACVLGRIVRVSVFGQSGLLGSTLIQVTSAFDSFVGVNTLEPITLITVLDEADNAIQGILNVRYGTSEFQLNNIPTLSEWGMIAAAGAMLLAGAFYAARRRKSWA